MSFEFNMEQVLKDMLDALTNSAKDDAGDIKNFAKEILKNEKYALKTLAEAKIKGDINEEVFKRELEREKKVLEVGLLTIEIMTKKLAQDAINAAMEVFSKAVKTALDTVL